MSLINKMLRDLDERQAGAVERAGLAAHLRALPAERKFPWARIWPVLAGAAIGAGGLWLFTGHGREAQTGTVAAPTLVSLSTQPTPAVPPSMVPATQPALRQAPQTSPVSQAQAAPGQPAAAQNAGAVSAGTARPAAPPETAIGVWLAQPVEPPQPGRAMAQARTLAEQGLIADALHVLARHAADGERSADYQAYHGVLLQQARRNEDSVERFRAATALRPGEGRWWYGLGLALDASQREAEAREAFQRALATGNLPAELAEAVERRLR